MSFRRTSDDRGSRVARKLLRPPQLPHARRRTWGTSSLPPDERGVRRRTQDGLGASTPMASSSAWWPRPGRIRLTYLFDPRPAVHLSLVDPLTPPDPGRLGGAPARQPLRFALCDCGSTATASSSSDNPRTLASPWPLRYVNRDRRASLMRRDRSKKTGPGTATGDDPPETRPRSRSVPAVATAPQRREFTIRPTCPA